MRKHILVPVLMTLVCCAIIAEGSDWKLIYWKETNEYSTQCFIDKNSIKQLSRGIHLFRKKKYLIF